MAVRKLETMRIPVLRVRYIQRFVDALSRRGFDGAALLRKADLDPSMLDDVNMWMPVSQLCRFLDLAVAETGYTTLGLDAGIRPREQHSAFSKIVLYSPTLYQSLCSVRDNASMEDTSARFRVTREGEFGWMNCGSIDGTDEAVRQIECYRYGAIVEIVRSAAGSEWVPPAVQFQATESADIAGADLLRDADVQFGRAALRFAIEPRHFSQPLFNVPDVPAESSRFDTDPVELPAALQEVVRTQVLTQRCTIKATAAAIGIAPRTLQRRLAENDMTFSGLLEYTRVETAKTLLAGEDMSITAVARQLGYKHSTHFSRAFSRVCGVTPREYRNLAKESVN